MMKIDLSAIFIVAIVWIIFYGLSQDASGAMKNCLATNSIETCHHILSR